MAKGMKMWLVWIKKKIDVGISEDMEVEERLVKNGKKWRQSKGNF